MERFLSKVNKTDTCWLWTASCNNDGYGLFWYEGKTIRAHRWSHEQHIGPIPSGLDVRHKCDVRHCVNPDHLEFGTNQDNVNDRQIRQRQSRGQTHRSCTRPELTVKGEQHHNSKISDDEVAWIRVLRGFYQNKELAEMYGMTPSSMSKVILGKSYQHVQ